MSHHLKDIDSPDIPSNFEPSEEPEEVKSICKFKRFVEVERECKPILSVSSKTKLGTDKIYGIAKDLSFQNGDWVQEAGRVPLMPFDESDMPKNFSESSVDPYVLSSKYSCKKSFEHSFMKDDRIMIVLRYPQIFSLTSRPILGEMISLNKKSDAKYFDKVQISSQLSYDSKYHFVSEQLVSRACNPYSCHELPDNNTIRVHKASQFCKVLKKFGSETFDIDSNLGPFVRDWETEGKNAMSIKLKLLITDLHCLPETNSPKTAKISAVFRALSSSEDRFYSGARTGLSGMTIAAEGTWSSSTCKLCMVGCIGLENDADGCDFRICLYLPGIFSITQRNILIGTISSRKETYVPLRFNKELRPLDIWNRYHDYSKSYLSYRFTKIEMVSALMQKDNSYNLGIRKIIHRFPGIEDDRNLTLLSSLSDEFSF
ncbi:hypothetical protein K7X08_013468 [Anisodus acutangulus]|uniref:DUF2921 domain-containing protein n=1 Tax=Anisodus acutangulus TaxID=402998 RepID=A0A9Q1R432_9SOLA|nr:hypothetical protein K7X08_013468 [Anisodus acutangulus]